MLSMIVQAESAAMVGYSDMMMFKDFLSSVMTSLGSSNSYKFSYLHFMNSFECGFNCGMTSLSNFSSGMVRLLVFFVLLDVEVVLFLNSFLVSSGVGLYFFYWLFLLMVMVGFLYEMYWQFMSFI